MDLGNNTCQDNSKSSRIQKSFGTSIHPHVLGTAFQSRNKCVWPTGHLDSSVPQANCISLPGEGGEVRVPHWALHFAWEPLISEKSCPDSSPPFRNLMIMENHCSFANSWIASFAGKIMYRKGREKRNVNAICMLTFPGPLWWEGFGHFFYRFWRYIIFQACWVLELLQSLLLFLHSGTTILT